MKDQPGWRVGRGVVVVVGDVVGWAEEVRGRARRRGRVSLGSILVDCCNEGYW
jgi:hypothetical protein